MYDALVELNEFSTMDAYNLYVDESCHLEKDGFSVMCLGYMKTIESEYKVHREAIKEIKFRHRTHAEIKWHNLSVSRQPLYEELMDYFFAQKLSFHSILVIDKAGLIKNEMENESPPDKLYYDLIFDILEAHNYPEGQVIKIYLDIKDTRGRDKVKKLSDRLAAANLGNMSFIHFQHIHSHENVLLQLVDLFIGAMAFKGRGEHLKPGASMSKLKFIDYLELKAGNSIDKETGLANDKFSVIVHQTKKD